MRDKRYIVSMSPHVTSGRTVRGQILTVILALLPALAWGVFQFHLAAVVLVVAAVAAAVITEATVNRLSGQALTIYDGHAVLVGLMLVMLIPAGAPMWLVVVGAVAAILVGKAPFGPLGGAPLSPALVGLLIVAISWPAEINTHIQPLTAPAELKVEDAGPAESPQQAVAVDPSDVQDYCIKDLFLGRQNGGIGTISPLLLLLGGLVLIWRRAGRWQGPVGFLLGVAVSAAIAHALDPGGSPPAAFQLTTGAVMFGAFFLCTEWTPTPVSAKGLFLFGLTAGVLTIIFRLTGMPFGRVAFAIAITSLATPLLDRIAATPFGKVVHHA